jgi:hypothetical protein
MASALLFSSTLTASDDTLAVRVGNLMVGGNILTSDD